MALLEKETEKLFYPIGEVADMFDVNTSLIRFWEKEFDIITPSKNKKGNRLFTKKDIENFKLIFHFVKEKTHPTSTFLYSESYTLGPGPPLSLTKNEYLNMCNHIPRQFPDTCLPVLSKN